jgi:hypothetical protein
MDFSMLHTIKAVVQGDHIHWQEAVDGLVPKDQPVEVLVTVIGSRGNSLSDDERGKNRLAALQALAEQNAFSDVQNPVEWQKRIREDRTLPGR